MPEKTGRGDEFIATHQRGDGDLRRHGPHSTVEKAEQQSRGALAGLVEVHVRISVIRHDGIAVLQHAVGEDAVQVE